jgi:hypothetical protein
MQQSTLFVHESSETELPPTPTQSQNNANLINQTSGNFEYYTPSFIVEAARRVMGSIDLDPASSPVANQTVGATRYYTITDDGLQQPWFGNVWMNHPFSRANNPKWIDKLRVEYEIGEVRQACCICFAATSESWFQPLFDYPLCFLSPRTNYLLPDGTLKEDVTKGSVVAYLGINILAFVEEFKPLGSIMLPVWRIQRSTLLHWKGSKFA